MRPATLEDKGLEDSKLAHQTRFVTLDRGKGVPDTVRGLCRASDKHLLGNEQKEMCLVFYHFIVNTPQESSSTQEFSEYISSCRKMGVKLTQSLERYIQQSNSDIVRWVCDKIIHSIKPLISDGDGIQNIENILENITSDLPILMQELLDNGKSDSNGKNVHNPSIPSAKELSLETLRAGSINIAKLRETVEEHGGKTSIVEEPNGTLTITIRGIKPQDLGTEDS
ncbi:hypothetical protein N9J72_01045 [Candidatus Gracilibacteria bacterium]|nr:hypothetical protein [Candidatus Gracilibacteria bacterium]